MKLFICLMTLVFLCSCNNLHEIDPGKYYRSGQLTKKEFAAVFENLGIKTVINLRGASPHREWYQEEVEVTEEYGINRVDIKMSADRIPFRKDLIKLLDAFRDAPRPILVHCQGGADRSGEASAIYQMLYMGKTKGQALSMLTPKYLHLRKRFPAKRYFIKELWEGEEWARHVYDPCIQDYQYASRRYCND